MSIGTNKSSTLVGQRNMWASGMWGFPWFFLLLSSYFTCFRKLEGSKATWKCLLHRLLSTLRLVFLEKWGFFPILGGQISFYFFSKLKGPSKNIIIGPMKGNGSQRMLHEGSWKGIPFIQYHSPDYSQVYQEQNTVLQLPLQTGHVFLSVDSLQT